MGLFTWAKRLSPGRQASADAARSLQPDAHREHQAGAASAGHGIDPGKRGVALLAAGDLHAARDAFAEAVRLNPGSAANHVNLAYALQQTGAEAEALPHLQRAVAIDPASFDAHYMLAGALERAPDLPGAAEKILLSRPVFVAPVRPPEVTRPVVVARVLRQQ